jgi:hypothetical protein
LLIFLVLVNMHEEHSFKLLELTQVL